MKGISETSMNRVNEVLPAGRMSALGMQHVLCFYAGGIAIPLIVGFGIGLSPAEVALLVSADLFTCGIATIIQSFGIGRFIGIKLPVVLGCAFAPMAVMITIGNTMGITAIYGSVIFGGLVMLLLAPVFGKLLKFFPPVVTGSIVTVVGASLIPVSFNSIVGTPGTPAYGSSDSLLLAAVTLLFILLLYKFTKGFIRSISILIGLIFGTAVAAGMGMVDFSVVTEASWFHVVTPFVFGYPVFKIDAMLVMSLTVIVVMIESIGTFFVIARYSDVEIENEDIARGLRAEGISTILGGIFNSFPYTTYGGNAGLIGLTKISSRFVVVLAGVFLVLLGMLPKFAALATIIPQPVLGAVTMIMYGMVTAAGIDILSRVDFTELTNSIIVAVTVGAGLGITVVPDVFKEAPQVVKILTQNGIVAANILAITLNIFFNYLWKPKASNKEIETNISH